MQHFTGGYWNFNNEYFAFSCFSFASKKIERCPRFITKIEIRRKCLIIRSREISDTIETSYLHNDYVYWTFGFYVLSNFRDRDNYWSSYILVNSIWFQKYFKYDCYDQNSKIINGNWQKAPVFGHQTKLLYLDSLSKLLPYRGRKFPTTATYSLKLVIWHYGLLLISVNS